MLDSFLYGGDAGLYGSAYFRTLAAAAEALSTDSLKTAGDLLAACIAGGRQIFSCGNGGSAAISNHLVCDCLKGTRAHTNILPRVISLSSNVELLTAIMNDIGQEEVFAYPLQSLASAGDVLITISSSGNSPNIVRAIEQAKSQGLLTIAMTGFSGGRSAQMADVNLHVAVDNYGIVEDLHQSMMHILAQYLRVSHLSDGIDAKQLVF